jgi:hypothetical protein
MLSVNQLFPVRTALPLPAVAQPKPPRALPAPPLANVAATLPRFAPISLAEMDGVALQDRIDTKYVLRLDDLLRALAELAPHYRALEIAGQRRQRYHTLYFDTPDFALYRQHHTGRRNRCKVRSRRYVDTDLTCLEVKLKGKGDRTVKQRLRTAGFVDAATPEAREFVQPFVPLDAALLQPVLANDFRRLTLVNTVAAERLTLDFDLAFALGAARIGLPGIVIAEVKQGQRGQRSLFVELMRAAHVRPSGFSKYCIGVSLLYPNQKHNNFNAQHRLLHKLMAGGVYGHA